MTTHGAFECGQCDKYYVDEIELQIHEQRHPKVFCEVCEKSFKTSRHLKQHKFIYTGEKLFQCKICQKSFHQTGVLSRHVATHRAHPCDTIRHKRYSCDQCEKSFKLEKYQQKHMRLICDNCGKQFKAANVLKQHQVIHTGEKLFQCKICDK